MFSSPGAFALIFAARLICRFNDGGVGLASGGVGLGLGVRSAGSFDAFTLANIIHTGCLLFLS